MKNVPPMHKNYRVSDGNLSRKSVEVSNNDYINFNDHTYSAPMHQFTKNPNTLYLR